VTIGGTAAPLAFLPAFRRLACGGAPSVDAVQLLVSRTDTCRGLRASWGKGGVRPSSRRVSRRVMRTQKDGAHAQPSSLIVQVAEISAQSTPVHVGPSAPQAWEMGRQPHSPEPGSKRQRRPGAHCPAHALRSASAPHGGGGGGGSEGTQLSSEVQAAVTE